MGVGERARYFRHPGIPGVDLLAARYVTHAFGRHAHDGYAIGVVCGGVEEFEHGGSLERVAAGQLALVNPEVAHTGHAGVPEGWTYRMLYPSVEVVADVAAELGRTGTPVLRGPAADDPASAKLLVTAHRAAQSGDALVASSLLRRALAALLRAHTAGPYRSVPRAGARQAARAREVLLARLDDPPSLTELAAGVGVSPFALSRAFSASYGLPPHAYLNQRRVRVARMLLDAGARPADAAVRVGFTDQAHLTRHFRRTLGVTPAAYSRDHGRPPE